MALSFLHGPGMMLMSSKAGRSRAPAGQHQLRGLSSPLRRSVSNWEMALLFLLLPQLFFNWE